MEQLPASAPTIWGGAKKERTTNLENLRHTTTPSSPFSRCPTALSCGHLSIKDQAHALGGAQLLSTSIFVIVFCEHQPRNPAHWTADFARLGWEEGQSCTVGMKSSKNPQRKEMPSSKNVSGGGT